MPRLENQTCISEILTLLLIGSGAGFSMSASLAAPVVNGYADGCSKWCLLVCAYDPLKSKKRKCLEGYSLKYYGSDIQKLLPKIAQPIVHAKLATAASQSGGTNYA